jgi:hypothetical protein
MMRVNVDLNNEGSDPAELTHDDVQGLLPEYATVAVFGNAPQTIYPQVAAHLERCPACRADLDELLTLTRALYQGEVAAAATYPQPDLSCLRGKPGHQTAPGRSSSVARPRKLVVMFSETWLPSRQPVLIGALRSSLRYRYEREPGSPQDLHVTVEVFDEDTLQQTVCVQVLVEMPDRDPFEQAGSQVMLHACGASWGGETDATGRVDFVPVPLDSLPVMRVEITPPVN